MIRILKERVIEGKKKYIEAAGLSTDSKPTADIVTGSTFIEADKGDIYVFAEPSTWTKIN